MATRWTAPMSTSGMATGAGDVGFAIGAAMLRLAFLSLVRLREPQSPCETERR